MQPDQTTTPEESNDGVKRFTTRRHDMVFYIDQDRFEGIPALPVTTAASLAQIANAINAAKDGAGKLMAALDVYRELLLPESYTLFEKRLSDKTNPIDMQTLLDVSRWLMGEAYGKRPTQLPMPSTPGQNETGTSSTDGAPPEVSIPALWGGNDTST